MIHKNKVSAIRYFCNLNGYDATSINRIGCGDSSDNIINKFNDGSTILCKEDHNRSRIYSVDTYGISYFLFENKVIGFAVYNPKLDWIKVLNLKRFENCQSNPG